MSARSWLARHAQTVVGSLGRLRQQPLATAMTLTVIAVALALPLLLTVGLQNIRRATAGWGQVIDVSVYLDKKAPISRVQSLARQLRGRPDVAAVRLIPADQALTEFRSASGFGGALAALNDNPLPDTLVITPAAAAGTPEGLETLKRELARTPDVQAVQGDTEWLNRLHAILEVLRRIVGLTTGLLALGVVLVVGNTIRLDILNRRSEIEVLKLLGATDGFARRPFLYGGLWYGLGGGTGALLLVAVAVKAMTGPVEHLAGLYGGRFHLLGPGFRTGAIVLGGATALGWAGSWLAATYHIRGVEPR